MIKFYKSLLFGVLISLLAFTVQAQITEDFISIGDGTLVKSYQNPSSLRKYTFTGRLHGTIYPGLGHGEDDYIVDSFNECLPAAPGTSAVSLGGIKLDEPGYLKIQSLWVFPSNNCETVSNSGDIVFVGKKSGQVQYTFTVLGSSLNNVQATEQGFTLINFANYSAANTFDIDELEVQLKGSLVYVALDDIKYTFSSLTQATNVNFTATQETQTSFAWANGTGTSRAVFMKEATTGSPVLSNNTAYTANAIFGSGTQVGSSGWYCVYNGTGTSVTITGLTSGTAYRVMVVEYNGTSNSQKYQGATSTNNPNNVTTSAVVTTPAITTSVTTLPAFSTCAGTASVAQSLTVSGSNLTDALVLTAPAGYEISPGSGSYSAIISIPSSGTLSVTVDVRLKSDATATPSGNITVGSAGATTQNIAVSGTVKTAPATPSASSNSPVASGATLNLSTPTVSGATYTWAGPNGFSSSVQNPSITNITAATAGTYSVTVTVNGCASAAGTTVVAIAVPPTITSLSSVSGAPGASITITGTNFSTTASNNIVFFGATKAIVTAASSTSLTVTVPVGATYAPVTVLNGDSKLFCASATFFMPTFTSANAGISNQNFDPKQDFTAGSSPASVAVGDLDGDGKPDLVVANYGSNNVTVFRNTSTSGIINSSSFAVGVSFAVGNGPYSLAIGDLDGDGKPDLVVVNYTGGNLSILRNTATNGTINSSSFAAKIDLVTGANPFGPSIGDLDGDGKPEIVLSNINNSNISVFKNLSSVGNLSSSSFAAKQDFLVNIGPNGTAIGDLDGDGKPDLAVVHYNSNTVSVLRNTTTSGNINASSFATKVDFTAGNGGQVLVIADFDGDGKPDMATVNEGDNTISVLRNTAVSGTINSSSFAAKVDFTVGTTPQTLAVGDFDGDGKPDLAVANSGTNNISVLRNTATSGSISASSFASKIDFPTGSGPFGLAIGDLDGDGKPDLITGNMGGGTTISVLRNNKQLLPVITPDADGIVRVKKSGAGNKTGDSWANAAAELADALKAAKTNTAIKEIWVAGGTYKPLYSAEDGTNFGTDKGRDNTFLLVKDVKVYGGFAGTETALTDRNLSLTANASILSGDIDNNDAADGTISGNNTYHVVISSGDIGTATLSGFTIKGGKADGGGNTIIVNGNSIKQNSGAGIYNHLSNLVMEKVIVSYNFSEGGDGAGVGNFNNSSPKIVNSLIHHNTGSFRGSGVYNAFSTPELVNVTITDNSNNPTVGVVYNDGSSAIIKNSIIWANTAGKGIDGNGATVSNSIVQGGYATGTAVLNADPQFTNAAAGDYTLSASSPAVNKGSNTSFTGLDANTKDLAGKPRVYQYGSGIIDMGAYELQANAATAITAVAVPANAVYGVGQTMSFTVKFGDNVTVATTGGTPRIALTIGSTTQYATYNTSGSGATDLVFNYTVQTGDLDADGIAIGSTIDLNGGTITDGASNAVVLTLNGVGATSGILVDGVAPVISSVNSSTANGTYKIGDVISIQINFSENVIVTGTPKLSLETGATDQVATYAPGSGTATLNFNYSVEAGDVSADLDYVSAAALALNGGTIRDAAGNMATLTLPAPGAAGSLGANKALVIDGVAPSVSSITLVGTSPTNQSQVSFTVTFSETVTGVDAADFTLTTSGGVTGATVSSVSGSDNLYAVMVNTGTGDGTIRLELKSSGTGIQDVAGNGIASGFTAGGTYTIDKTPPTTTVATFAFSDDSGASSTDFITNIAAQTLSGTLSANLQTGEKVYISLDNGVTYTLVTTNVGSNTFSLSGVTLSGSSTIKIYVADEAGNQGTIYSQAYTLDTTAPAAPTTLALTAASDSGVSNTDHITNVTKPTFTGKAEAGSTVILYSGTTVLGTGIATGGDWEITVTSALAEGTYNITAKATDLAGNESSASSALAVTIDTTKPTVSITSSVSTLKKDETATITATITFTFSEDPGSSFSAGDITVTGGTISGISGTGLLRTATFTPNANTDNGTAGISVTAGSYTDIAGNLGQSGTLSPTITYDTKAPAQPTGLTAIFDNQQSILTWTANAETDLASYKVYGGTSTDPTDLLATITSPALTYTHTGLINGTTYYYRITAVDQTGNESVYSSQVTAIPKASQIIIFNVLADKTYGDADFDAGATASSGLTVSYSSDNTSVATIVAGKIHIVGTGTANITASQAGNNFYKAATDEVQTLTVKKRALVITATASNKTYDGNNIATVSLSDDRVSGDVLTATYTAATFDNKNVGTNKPVSVGGISISGADADNYMFSTTASATAVITTKTLMITATAADKVYNGNNIATVSLSDNRVSSDVLTATYTAATFDNKNVGTNKTVSVSGISISGTDADNYAINTTASATASITMAKLSYVATAAGKFYGDANPVLAGTVTGFVTGDNQTNATSGTLNFGTIANNASNKGSYAINGSGLTATNYILEQAAGNATALTITARPISIKADAKSKTYGDDDPALTYQVTSGNLVNGDTFTGALIRDNGQNAGSYAIRQGTVVLSDNYDLSYQPENLSINKALLTVTANNSARCYGTGNPAFSVSYSGFKYSDNENGLVTKPVVNTAATASSVAGSYELIPSGGVSDNYDFSYVKGTLTVNPIPVNTIVSDKGTSISKGETAVLTVNSNNGTSYSWSSAEGIISGYNSAVLTVRPLETTTYTVTVRNSNGCESVSTITIEVRNDYAAIEAENFMTPNGDGVNDTWVIKNIDAYPNHTLTIFDRAGREIYKVKNYKNDWGGELNGSPLSGGTYYYILKFDEPGVQYLRGFITIVRSK